MTRVSRAMSPRRCSSSGKSRSVPSAVTWPGCFRRARSTRPWGRLNVRDFQVSEQFGVRVLPAGWDLRVQSAITLTESEPEPDFAIVRGDESAYLTRHPTTADIGLVVEVSDSTLPGDRDDKGRIYARAGIPCYWIVNLVDRQVEVHTLPSGPVADPRSGQQINHRPGDS